MAKATILWLAPGGWSENQKIELLQPMMAQTEYLHVNACRFVVLSRTLGSLYTTVKGRQGKILDHTKVTQIKAEIRNAIIRTKPKAIVINCEWIFRALTGKNITSLTARGSVIDIEGIPAICIDSISRLSYSQKAHKGATNKHDDIRWFKWATMCDIYKLERLAIGDRRPQPPFNFELITDVENLRHHCSYILENSLLIAIDIETNNRQITCFGYTYITKQGECLSITIPLIDPTKENGCYWQNEEDEFIVWECIKLINDCPVMKCGQNAILYDNSYCLHYGVPIRNLLFDTYQMFHQIWVEAPRSLGFIASILLDNMVYWKDETDALDAGTEKSGTKKWIPQTQEGLEIFWLYNALDTYFTLCCTLAITHVMPTWAWSQYTFELFLQIKFALEATTLGLPVNETRQQYLQAKHAAIAERELKIIHYISDDVEFNPRSPTQLREYIYGVFNHAPVKQRGKNSGETTDKKIVALLQAIDPVLDAFMTPILAYKEAEANAAKYGSLNIKQGFMYYQINASGTGTGRSSSSEHPMKWGTNIQNIPGPEREMFVAPEGYAFIEVDYSQSDFWYTAFFLNDPEMIETLLDPRDTHCLNAAYFFQKSYDDIFKGYKANEDWVVHPIKGVRQNTKRVVYGANYIMAGFTLYATLGHAATVATAVGMGHKTAPSWPQSSLINFCANLVTKYWHRFNVAWNNLQRVIDNVERNGGAFIDPWGRIKIFFGDIKDGSVQRKIAAEIGQAGTAGAINRSIFQLKHESKLLDLGAYIPTQTHDSIVTITPLKNINACIEEMIKYTRQPLELHGNEFTVPVDVSVGISWGKRMLHDISPENYQYKNVQRLREHEQKLIQAYGG